MDTSGKINTSLGKPDEVFLLVSIMTYKKSKDQLAEVFKLAADCAKDCGEDVAKAHNLHMFSTQLGYLDAALMGGKLTAKQAARQAKDLYKAWKEANKNVELE